ncbi:MAG: thiamine phosphate synthase [Tahibacter sp.]
MSTVRLAQGGLYSITDGPRADLIAAAGAALAGGSRVLQYRDKTSDHARRLEECAALRILCHSHGCVFIVNDDVELALMCDADGLHLGESDVDFVSARASLGQHRIIGVSCYASLDRAERLAGAGADYLAFGTFFDSPTKPAARRAPLDILKQAKRFGLPVVAIGGITLENGRNLLSAGADFLAVISGVFGAADVRSAAERYCELFLKSSDDST